MQLSVQRETRVITTSERERVLLASELGETRTFGNVRMVGDLKLVAAMRYVEIVLVSDV